MREDELEKNLQPFLAYLAQTPVNELLNDYFNEYGIHEDGFIVAIPCEKAWGLSIKEKSRIAAMIEKERMEASQRRGSYEW